MSIPMIHLQAGKEWDWLDKIFSTKLGWNAGIEWSLKRLKEKDSKWGFSYPLRLLINDKYVNKKEDYYKVY